MNKSFRFLLFSLLVHFLMNISSLRAQSEFLIYSTLMNDYVTMNQFINDLSSYDVVYLGEQHDDITHHQSQKAILQGVSDNVGPIAVGLEFVDWTKQEYLTQYIHGQITREEFLTEIQWGNDHFSFDFYNPLLQVAHNSGGHVFGINAPKSLTQKIAKNGINSLSDYDFSFMPPHFQLGSPLYFERFKAVMESMPHPVPITMLNNLFEVQSVWDETMSFHAVLNLKHSYTPFFIIVGNFHIAYKLGSPASIANRLLGTDRTVATVYHVNIQGMSEDEIKSLVKQHERYGYIADYIVMTKEQIQADQQFK